MQELKRGDVFYVQNSPTTGSEQRAGRPAVIVSNNKNNRYSKVVQVVYLTTQPKSFLPTHFTVCATGRESTALCEQITTISISRIGDYVGTLSRREVAKLNTSLLISLGLHYSSPKRHFK